MKIKGLEKRTELNGVCGSIIDYAADASRFAVRLVSSECIRAKESNLTLMSGSEVSNLSLAYAGAPSTSSLREGSELVVQS